MDNTSEKKSFISNLKEKITIKNIENIIWKNNLRKGIFISTLLLLILSLVYINLTSNYFISNDPYIEDSGNLSSIDKAAEIILYIGEKNIQNGNFDEALFGSDSTYFLPEEIEGNSIKFPGLIEFTKDSKISNSKYSEIANYHIGICYYRLDEESENSEEEVKYYTEAINYLEKESESSLFNSFKKSQIGDIFFQLGDLEKALKYYNKSLELEDNKIFRAEILFKTAETEIILKNYDSAINHYVEIKNDFPNSPYSSDSDKRIAEIKILSDK